MSDIERQFLEGLSISHETVGKALGKTRQTVSRGLKDAQYFSEERLRLVADYLDRKVDAELGKKFREEAARLLSAGASAFAVKTTSLIPDQPMPAVSLEGAPGETLAASIDDDEGEDDGQDRPWTKAKELWIFNARPRELTIHGFLEWMRSNYFDLSRGTKFPTRRLVYFCAPDRARRLGRYFLEIFEPIDLKDRNRVIVLETRAMAMCPHYIIMDPLEAPQAWAFGQNEYADEGWIRLAQGNVAIILDNLKEAGVAGLADKFFAETFSDDGDDNNRNVPRFELRFDSSDLEKSRMHLKVPSLSPA